MMFEQDFGIHVCSSEQDVVKNCDYLVMGVKPNIVESVISKIKSVIDQQVIVSIVAGYGNDKYCLLYTSFIPMEIKIHQWMLF